MKSILTAFIIFIIMLTTMFFSTRYLSKVCSNLKNLNTQIERDIDKDDWNSAYNHSLKFLNQWDKYSKRISIFVNHTEIDNINNELWKITQYTKVKNKDESLASNHVIKFYLDHIEDLEKVNLQNIF
ncbi:DUF4363 family protein [Clostridium sp. DJ247]|uniref:DUF4363 family protein n=1 Tax=Clostridium sp. DJ247 TaxID=2726188 RepID=UPI0028BD3512|nr:DUF4363 family protein [Clostridium sp. DJ247]MBC2581535.1 DUF4363 family protein [Clostridium sp. DJ247]